MIKLAIVIPAYNEEKRIGRTLKAYSKFFKMKELNREIKYELLIVINNTKDRTEDVVRAHQRFDENLRYLNLPEGGKGNAVIVGFKDVLSRDNDLVGFVDADMATSPEEYFKIVLEAIKYDGAIGDRYTKGSVISPKPTIKRLIAKKAFNYLSRALLLLPFEDTQCGAKIFKRKAILDILPKLSMSQWAFDVEILYNLKKLGYKIKSVPTRWYDQEYSTINFWKSGPFMALSIIRLRLIYSPFKIFIKVYDKFGGYK